MSGAHLVEISECATNYQGVFKFIFGAQTGLVLVMSNLPFKNLFQMDCCVFHCVLAGTFCLCVCVCVCVLWWNFPMCCFTMFDVFCLCSSSF